MRWQRLGGTAGAVRPCSVPRVRCQSCGEEEPPVPELVRKARPALGRYALAAPFSSCGGKSGIGSMYPRHLLEECFIGSGAAHGASCPSVLLLHALSLFFSLQDYCPEEFTPCLKRYGFYLTAFFLLWAAEVNQAHSVSCSVTRL